MRVLAATLTPFEDTFKVVNPALDYFYNPEKEKTRQAVNQWIRESKEFDGVIDFDAVARDPDRPSHIKAAFDSGDHLHPGDGGFDRCQDANDAALTKLLLRSPRPANSGQLTIFRPGVALAERFLPGAACSASIRGFGSEKSVLKKAGIGVSSSFLSPIERAWFKPLVHPKKPADA